MVSTNLPQKSRRSTRQKAAFPNPWTREHWNISLQYRIAVVSLDEARRMARKAGSQLAATQPPPFADEIDEIDATDPPPAQI